MAKAYVGDRDVQDLYREDLARQSRRDAVLRRLQEAPGHAATAMLEAFCEGDYGHDYLDYEDWVCPLRATGGDVCLEAILPAGAAYFSVNRRDMLVAQLDGRFGADRLEGAEAIGMLRAIMQMDVLEPVRREDTPFAEV